MNTDHKLHVVVWNTDFKTKTVHNFFYEYACSKTKWMFKRSAMNYYFIFKKYSKETVSSSSRENQTCYIYWLNNIFFTERARATYSFRRIKTTWLLSINTNKRYLTIRSCMRTKGEKERIESVGCNRLTCEVFLHQHIISYCCYLREWMTQPLLREKYKFTWPCACNVCNSLEDVRT